MPSERWIVIPRWDDFQHPDASRSGTIPWLKMYTRLLSDETFLGLSHHRRGVLLGLWLEYARARRHLSDSTVTLSRRLGQRVLRADLEALNHAGFIEFSASKPASTPASKVASLDKRREETPISPSGTASKTRHQHVCGINGCTVKYDTEQRILEHRENVHDVTPDVATNGDRPDHDEPADLDYLDTLSPDPELELVPAPDDIPF